jgi:nitrate reductase gamma subunit
MEAWIDFAKGPLFAVTFLIMTLGLARLLIIQVYNLIISKGGRLKNAPWKSILSDAVTWFFPVKHMIKGTVIFSAFSFMFHIGIILVPLFLAEHIVLWEDFLGANLPSIGKAFADFLTLFTIGCILVLLTMRIFVKRQRAMSRPMDYFLLIAIFIPFLSGYLASHPGSNPFTWQAMMLVHLLSGELLFVLIPFTKLAHIVLYFFDRISGLHWQLRPGAGDRVAKALFDEEARV